MSDGPKAVHMAQVADLGVLRHFFLKIRTL